MQPELRQHCDVELFAHEKLGAGQAATVHLATEVAEPDPHADEAFPITLKTYNGPDGDRLFDVARTEGIAARAAMGENDGFADVLYPPDETRKQIPFEHARGRVLEREMSNGRSMIRKALLAFAVGDFLYPRLHDAVERGVVPCDFRPANIVAEKEGSITFDTKEELGTRQRRFLTLPRRFTVIDNDNHVRLRRDSKYTVPTLLSALYCAPEGHNIVPQTPFFVLGTILDDVMAGVSQRMIANGRYLSPEEVIQHISEYGMSQTDRPANLEERAAYPALQPIATEVRRLTDFILRLHAMDPDARPTGRDAFREQVVNGSVVLRNILGIED